MSWQIYISNGHTFSCVASIKQMISWRQSRHKFESYYLLHSGNKIMSACMKIHKSSRRRTIWTPCGQNVMPSAVGDDRSTKSTKLWFNCSHMSLKQLDRSMNRDLLSRCCMKFWIGRLNRTLEESIMKGTRLVSGSATNRLTNLVMAPTPSIRPSSILMSSKSAPCSTYKYIMGKAFRREYARASGYKSCQWGWVKMRTRLFIPI